MIFRPFSVQIIWSVVSRIVVMPVDCHRCAVWWSAYIFLKRELSDGISKFIMWCACLSHITLWVLKPCLRVLSLKSTYAKHQTVHRWHQPASPQIMIQHFSRFELGMNETSPETTAFKVSKLPQLEVTDNMKNMTLCISSVNSHPLIWYDMILLTARGSTLKSLQTDIYPCLVSYF